MSNIQLKATARVTLTKLDENGNVVGTEVQNMPLTEEEAKELWRLQQQE